MPPRNIPLLTRADEPSAYALLNEVILAKQKQSTNETKPYIARKTTKSAN